MIDVILTDIEGTTSSIHFVKDVLFPYASAHLGEFVRRHADESEVKPWLDRVREEASLDVGDTDALIATLRQWIVEDRKHTALKALQGMIWKDGYERGEYRAHLYPEVAARLRAWKAQGLELYVYSSGSVAAQKLFFGFSEAGDLLALFSGYFDTEVGGKREAKSYQNIAQAIGKPASSILFLSDIREEIDAARDAGMAVTWVRREAPLCPANGDVPCVADFDAIRI